MRRRWLLTLLVLAAVAAAGCDEEQNSSGGVTVDRDDDGIEDGLDNCPDLANPDQADADGDDVGDACDEPTNNVNNSPDNNPNNSANSTNNVNNNPVVDRDGDGVLDDEDSCPDIPNPGQEDLDGDGSGDVCDDDRDGDSVDNNADNCPDLANTDQANLDEDDAGDACDDDRDGDGTLNADDNCPDLANGDQADLDLDDAGDVCDDDRDGDDVANADDNCPDLPNTAQDDLDEDGLGNTCDDDLDGDAVLNTDDNCPGAPNADQTDLDEDAAGDVCDDDLDGDGVVNADDNCPDLANDDQANLDEDAAGDACDDDLDGDGTPNDDDNCPVLANADQSDLDEDAAGDACDEDLDGDGVVNTDDNCPSAPNADQTDLDEDAAGDACDDDLDGDGTLNADDNCPDLANDDQADLDEDATGDACDDDLDGDDVPNDEDNCPVFANPDQLDLNENAVGDACDDDDEDGILNALDNCRIIPNAEQSDADNDGVGDVCDVCVDVADPEQLDSEVAGFAASALPIDFAPRPVPETIAVSGDDNVASVPTGFPVTFFGQTWETILVSTNGLLGFGSGMGSGCCAAGPLENAPVPEGGLIAVYWTDLNTNSGGNITYGIQGEEPNRELVISYNAVAHFGGGAPVSAQVIFTEGVDGAEIHCISCTPPGGRTHTQGIVSPDREATAALEGRVVTTFSAVEDAVRFTAGTTQANDGVGDACDVCPLDFDPEQGDADEDGVGDLCDNCPEIANPDQESLFPDSGGVACSDFDEDGTLDITDNCPFIPNADQADGDEDGVGDVCDNCPDVPNPGQESLVFGEGPGPGAACSDLDEDEILDIDDNCPFQSNTDQANGDGDSFGDVCDVCPDAINAPDSPDSDEDGVPDVCDNCIEVFNPDQRDLNEDGIGDLCGPELDCEDGYDIDADEALDEDAALCLGAVEVFCEPTSVTVLAGMQVNLFGGVSSETGLRRLGWDLEGPEGVEVEDAAGVDFYIFTPETPGRYTATFYAVESFGESAACAVEVNVIELLDCPDGIDNDDDGAVDEDEARCAEAPLVLCPEPLVIPSFGTAEVEALLESAFPVVQQGWEIVESPAVLHSASLSPDDAAVATFAPDLFGAWTLRFTVLDAQGHLVACETPVIHEEPLDCEDAVDSDGDGVPDEDPGCDLPPTITCPEAQIVPVLDTLSLSATAQDDGTLIRTEWLVASAPDGSEALPSPQRSPSTSFRPFLPGEYVLRFVATDDQSQQSACEVTVTVTVEERLRVELLWDIDIDPAPQNDVDLHLLHPDATAWFASPLDCFYSNATPQWGLAGSGATEDNNAANNPSLDVDDTNGRGPENIDIPSPLLGVPYRVGAHFFADNGGGPESQVIIRVYCDGEVAQSFGPVTLGGTQTGNTSANDFWKVADVTFSETGCEITPLLTPEGAPQIITAAEANSQR